MGWMIKPKISKEAARNIRYIEERDMTIEEIKKEIQSMQTAIQESTSKGPEYRSLVNDFIAEKNALKQKLEKLEKQK